MNQLKELQKSSADGTKTIQVRVNGQIVEREVHIRMLLVDFLREELGLTGTHVGCSVEGRCGACTILLNGENVKSCLTLAVQADGANILTVEGLGTPDNLHPIQEGFWEKHGLQCGFCTPGMMMSAYNLLKVNPHPSSDEIREAIVGNLCRCTGYEHIIEAVQYAAERLSSMSKEEREKLLTY
ncbi:carbon monoxide dehydrogenase [Collibacillus ludicampi]|uniref:Carbon monoxide dehydrogenase n=1 Tax=Collibacillus ludicampi TaxID=2771369 RepID=A0AAV4LBC3_9BACL|nr:(2Fe-2S)-binding protein [Collibacillus ludicampi]GIM44968.1 carbon monoxide dehydrogenase [Collibacillus ludicampi]